MNDQERMQPLNKAENPNVKTYTGQRTVKHQESPNDRHPSDTKHRARHWFLPFMLSVLSLIIITAAIVLMAPKWLGIQLTSIPSFAFIEKKIVLAQPESIFELQKQRDMLSLYENRFLPGVTVDGLDVSGMTFGEAEKALGDVKATGGGEFEITVRVGNMTWKIDSSMVPMTRNIDEILTQAYALGRQISNESTTESMVEKRWKAMNSLSQSPVSFETSLTWDGETIRTYCQQIAQAVSFEPVNATVSAFDPIYKTFTFTKDQPGRYLDSDSLYQLITDALYRGDYFKQIEIEPETEFAAVTREDLIDSFGQISSYSTTTTSNKNRNKNIELSAMAINGKVVQPGEVFSFNQTTGQRSEAKGYKEATAISGGQSVPEVGGGVCQTSSTLFNAVARANLEIVERSPHAWPSSYVEKGFDATVNWPGLDFKWKNNTQWPVYIVAWYNNRKITVELYGHTLGKGITIELSSKVVETIEAPKGVNMVQNPSLPHGTRKTTVKARKGYLVETWQVWKKDGIEFDRKLFCNSRYKAYQETVEYN